MKCYRYVYIIIYYISWCSLIDHLIGWMIHLLIGWLGGRMIGLCSIQPMMINQIAVPKFIRFASPKTNGLAITTSQFAITHAITCVKYYNYYDCIYLDIQICNVHLQYCNYSNYSKWLAKQMVQFYTFIFEHCSCKLDSTRTMPEKWWTGLQILSADRSSQKMMQVITPKNANLHWLVVSTPMINISQPTIIRTYQNQSCCIHSEGCLDEAITKKKTLDILQSTQLSSSPT